MSNHIGVIKKFGKQFAPARNANCPCGSGKKFKRCCADLFEKAQPGKGWPTLLKSGDLRGALQECRAEITKYSIWHKSHTEPALRAGTAEITYLLKTDERALAELVHGLIYCYRENGIAEDLSETLDRLWDNIATEWWQRKIVYFRALSAVLGSNWDRAKGRAELSKLGDITENDDCETIQLYVDLFGDLISFSKKLELAGWIVDSAETNGEQLHYRGLRAILYLTAGDQERAVEEVERALKEFGHPITSENQLYFGENLAGLTQLLGFLKKDNSRLHESIRLYEDILCADNWTAEGKAHVYKQIGDSFRELNDWDSALVNYRKSLSIVNLQLTRVFLSECLANGGKLVEAETSIRVVETEKLAPAEYLDYGFVFAQIALLVGTREILEEAKTLLQKLDIEDLYFSNIRDKLRITILELLIGNNDAGIVAGKKKDAISIAKLALKYLILKPSFLGFGVDIGKIIEDLSTSKVKRDK